MDSIRAPDKTKREQLIQDTRSEYDKQIAEAIQLSIQELNEKEENNRLYEDNIINEHNKIVNERTDSFRGFLFDINRLIRFDKNIKEIYEIIEPIIDAYCCKYINQYEIDCLTYDKIFNVLSTIRTNKNTIELLKQIIKCE